MISIKTVRTFHIAKSGLIPLSSIKVSLRFQSTGRFSIMISENAKTAECLSESLIQISIS